MKDLKDLVLTVAAIAATTFLAYKTIESNAKDTQKSDYRKEYENRNAINRVVDTIEAVL